MLVEVDRENSVYMLHPRPAVVIVAGDWEDYSAMAASWIMPVSRRPPLLAVAVSPRRYTYTHISRTGGFAVCVLPLSHLKALHFLGTVSGREVRDKIAAAGLTKVRAKRIGCPVIGESIAVAECRVLKDMEAGDHRLIVGEVLEYYVKQGAEPPNPRSYSIPLHVQRNLYTYTAEVLAV